MEPLSGCAWYFLFIYGLCCLTAGFAWGRRHGKQEGVLLGRNESPLLLRHASLAKGYCVLCEKDGSKMDIGLFANSRS